MIPKFRAYSETNKDMVSWGNLLNLNVSNIFRNPEMCGMVLMQSTGLHDKNGVEIYEGDILQSEYYFKYQVVFKGDCWRCEPLKNKRFKNRFIGGDLEVIGNIWEDGDLIDSE